jgi:type II secretion system protein D
VRDVLAYYERLTGKKVIYDNTVQGTVNIVVSAPVSKEEAVRIIEISLLLNGYTLVPADRGILKVVSPAKNPRTTGVPIYSDEEQIPDADQVITFLFKLQYADPTELQQTLAQYISPQIFTSVVALPKSQAILITESTSVIRGLVKIIREIDIPPAEVVSEFIKLERADAKDVLEKLEKLFEKSPTQGGAAAGGVARPRMPGQEGLPPSPETPPGAAEQQAKALSEESIIVGKIKLTADIRTNRIHVVTRPVNLPFIRKLIHEFDSDVKFGEPTTRKLRYVSAGDVLPVIVKSITEPGIKAEEGAAGQAGGAQQSRQPQQQQYTGGAQGTQGGGTLNVNEELSTEPTETKPEAVTIGNTKIIADKRVNAIIVLGNQEVKEKIFKVLDQIDVRSPQVMLNTVIGELTLDKNMEINFDYLLHFKGNGSGATTASGSGGSIFGVNSNNNAVFNTASLIASQAFQKVFEAGSGGLSGAIATNSLDVLVNALESTDRFRITQRPMVFASNNKKAIIASGQEIAVPTQTLSSLNAGVVNTSGVASVSSSVEYKKVALQLEIVPLINSDREVSMDILQKIDNVVPGANTIVGGNSIPTIATRYIKTNVSVPNKATIILGGLITLNNTRSAGGIPYLTRIPLLGYLFSDTKKALSRTELIILIRPEVTTSPYETIAIREHEQDRLQMEPDLESTLDPPQSEEAMKRAKAAKDKSELLNQPQPSLRPGT